MFDDLLKNIITVPKPGEPIEYIKPTTGLKCSGIVQPTIRRNSDKKQVVSVLADGAKVATRVNIDYLPFREIN